MHGTGGNRIDSYATQETNFGIREWTSGDYSSQLCQAEPVNTEHTFRPRCQAANKLICSCSTGGNNQAFLFSKRREKLRRTIQPSLCRQRNDKTMHAFVSS